MENEILVNPTMKWATPPSEQGRVRFIEGMTDAWPVLPHEGDVLTLPFIVDPTTSEPVPVRVLQLVKQTGATGHVMVIVVSRVDQRH